MCIYIVIYIVCYTSLKSNNSTATLSFDSATINLGSSTGDYNIQSTKCYLITTCNERRINQVHLKFPLYTNCLNRPCGKEFNTTALANLHIYNVYVNIILWINLNIVTEMNGSFSNYSSRPFDSPPVSIDIFIVKLINRDIIYSF